MAYKIKAAECSRCFACVLKCPARAISTEDNYQAPVIDPSRCINCGECLNVCRPTAIKRS